MLSWVGNGGCAELNGIELDPESERSGFVSAAPGVHGISVWGEGGCAGSPDLTAEETVVSGPDPAGTLDADPNLISSGGSSVLSWSLLSGSLITGLISHGVMDEVTVPSGSVQIMPPNTVQYNLTLVTKQGGVVRTASVWVDEEPSSLFADGFESGDFLLWSFFSP